MEKMGTVKKEAAGRDLEMVEKKVETKVKTKVKAKAKAKEKEVVMLHGTSAVASHTT